MLKKTRLQKWRETQRIPGTDKPLPMSGAAELVSVSKSTWSRWERELEPIGVKAVPRVESVTGIPRHLLRSDVFGAKEDAAA